MATELTKRVFMPVQLTGRVYIATYGSDALPLPCGGVLEAALTYEEDVQTHADMSAPGGGTYYEHRRVKSSKLSLKLCDLNVTNVARATRSVVREIQAGTITDVPFTAQLGGLLRSGHPNLADVVLKKGATALAATAVDMAGNYEVRPSGIYLLPEAEDIADSDKLWLSGSNATYVKMETAAAASTELRLVFEGMNEANDNSPLIIDIHRVSSGMAKSLGLLTGKLGVLDLDCTLLSDPTKTGPGISKFAAISVA